MNEPIKSVEEFIDRVNRLESRWFVYRGLADADWEVISAAYRRLEASSETEPSPKVFQNYVEQLLNESSLQGFRDRQDRTLSDLELLAELQHYGAATCLIDFTTNALTALWFACDGEFGKAGRVVAMATDDPDGFSTVSYERLKKPIKQFLNTGKLWKWTPGAGGLMNNRIVAQQSVFVFGEGKIEKRHYEKNRDRRIKQADHSANIEKVIRCHATTSFQ